MATEAQINAICGLYVAYFDRAADPEGLQFWINQLDNGRDFATISQDFANSQEARDIYPFLNNPDVASPMAFISSIYANLFDRAPEAEGLQFWTNVLESGAVAPGDMVEAILLGARDDIVDGELVQDATIVANKIEAAKYYTEEAANTPGFEFDQTAYNAARAAINGVDATEASVATSKFDTDNFVGQAGNQASNIHTLMEQKILVSPEVVTEQLVTNTVTFWGFNPHSHDETDGVDNTAEPNSNNLTNEGIEDGGVPLSDLLNYFQALAGTNLFEMDTIDTDAGDFPDLSGVTNISLSGPANTGNSGDGSDTSGGNNVDVNNGGGTLTLHYDDFEADIALGQEYFDLLHSLIFDEEGNSRLFQKEVAADVTVYVDDEGNVTLDDGVTTNNSTGNDSIGTVDAILETVEDAVYATIPLILTPTQNNNATQERSFTDRDGVDDTIVAGRLELLHNAYIDAGLGHNTLEIDAKGYFAQPKQLLNIQQINIHQLPNIYTDDLVDEDGDGEIDLGAENLFPNLSLDGAFDNDSIIDLSRATSLEALTLTQGDFEDLDAGGSGATNSVESDPGDLTVTGIRNGAIATIDGHWVDGDLRLNYSGLQGDGVHVVFNNLHMDDSSDLEIGHNATKLTIESTGGGNYIYDGNLVGDDAEDGGLNTLIITGDAHLYIEDDMDYTFSDDTPITIDASANTGGVDLNFTSSEKVTFIGSQGDDRFTVETDESNEGSVNIGGSDQSVTITDMEGDNYFRVDSNNINITVGDGDNTLELGGETQNNSGNMSTATVVAGNGSNDIAASTLDIVSITAGDGGNKISANANEINIETGSGNDTVIVSGQGGTSDLGDGDSSAPEDIDDAALLNINVGGGENTVVLGGDVIGVNYTSGITATAGSSISGENVTLYVEEPSDLRAAELSGITNVVLDLGTSSQIDTTGSEDPEVGNATIAPVLTLTDTQLAEIGAGNINVDQAAFNTYGQLKIIVTESTSLTDLGVDDLPTGVDLVLELQDGVQLEMTAEQLHTRVAPEGVTLANDGNTDQLSGSVLITDAGLDFDPFNNSDQVRTEIGGNIYYGGSLSPADFSTATGAALDDGIQMSEWGFNVLVDASSSGYDRPADAPSYSRVTIDTADGDILPFDTPHTFLRIIGDEGAAFTPVQPGVDEWGRPLENVGNAIELGVDTGPDPDEFNPFIVDFSSVGGELTNLTFAHFENAEAMFGNGDARVNVEIGGDLNNPDPVNDGRVASAESGLFSRGIATYVVTDIDTVDTGAGPDGQAEFWTSRVTQDLEVLGLQGNYEQTITFGNTERGVDFLMEVARDKFDGYAVGSLVADFARPGADAVVNVVGLDDLPEGEVQKVAGIDVTDAATADINITGGDTVIEAFSAADAEDLTLVADADLTIEGDLPTSLSSIDASGVVGVLTASIDGNPTGDSADFMEGGFDFIGAQGGTVLTLDDLPADPNNEDPAAYNIDGGAAGVELIIDGGPTGVDLTASTLVNVTNVTLTDTAELTLTMDQADEIGASNFQIADGDTADLMLTGLSDQVFAKANYDDDINVSVTLANDPVVTLNPLTDLTGIASLNVPEGTTLNLTAAQFQQLNGDGTLTGDGNVHITDMTQADVGVNGADLDLDDLDVTGTVSVTLAEDVNLSDADLFDSGSVVDTFNVGDGMTLVLGEVTEFDGVDVIGGTDSTLQFTDLNGFLQNIDASGFDVDVLRITDLLVSGNNVDYIFAGLSERVTKVIYNGDGDVEGRLQNVIVEEGTTIFGDISFNEYQLETEISVLSMNLEGGTLVDGDLVLSTVEVNIAVNNLIPSYLQELIINSSGTAGNNVTGNTANIIDGDITPAAYFFAIGAGSRDNNLKTVTITADQNFEVTGEILFSSHGDDNDAPLNNQPNDGVTANDDNEATATLNVSGAANTTIGDLDTADDDIDALVVNHTGDGTLTFGLSSLSTVDADDAITVNGSATGDTVINVSGELDLSDDTLVNVNAIVMDESGGISASADVSLTITQAQLNDIGAGNITVNEDGQTAYLNINAFDGTVPFDATALDGNIDDVDIFMADGVQTLDPTTNLTGVDTITVPEGGVLNLTAEQYLQLDGPGSIIGDGSTDYTVNITGLTQADVDAGLDLTGITADNLTVTLAEDVSLAATDDLGDASVIIPDNLTLGLATAVQADGLDVDGGTDSTVIFQFDSTAGLPGGPFAQIDASNYDVTTLKALATFVGGLNAEFTIDDLPSSVLLQLFQDPEELGFLNPTNRMVFIEEDVVVPANGVGDALIFNDWDTEDEVRTLSVTMDGGVIVEGDISLPTRTNKDGDLIQRYFETLSLVSQGDEVNTIEGAIDTQPSLGFGPNTDENNLLDVAINATQDLVVEGELVFNYTAGSDTVANLMLLGDADVSIKALDTTDADITGLNVNNAGTGTLTVTGGSDSLELGEGTTSLVFEGTGNIVLDTDDGGGNNGIDGEDLEEIDASGLSGDLTLGVVEDISNTDFVFTSGTGVTTMTLVEDTLNADVTANPAETGWTFDFSNAAVGSEFHIGDGPGGNGPLTFTQGPLNIDLGANTTLFINEDTDWTDLDLSIMQGQPIVLADGATLALTAEQADGLNIVGESGPLSTGKVNIIDLGDDPVDLSGISSDVAEFVALEDDDVTVDATSNLGFFTVALVANSSADLNPAGGQIIRFSTEEQAARAIEVFEAVGDPLDPGAWDTWDVPGDDNNNTNTSNVAWLFNSISGQVDTSEYDANIGRLWVSADLINSEGGDIENLFTTLPNSILRVDFNSVTELDVLFSSNAIDRFIELMSFTDIDGLVEIDDDISPEEEHIQNLHIEFGGEVEVGDVVIGDVVAAPDTDPLTPEFETLTLNSRVALDDEHFLATEDYVNDNDTTVESGETAQPIAVNTIGDIMVGGSNPGIDLLDVTINTFRDASTSTFVGDGDEDDGDQTVNQSPLSTLTNDGADFVFGTLFFDSETAGSGALLTVTGDNDVTGKAFDASDVDVTSVTVSKTGAGSLVWTGGSPAFNGGEDGASGNTESLIFEDGSSSGLGANPGQILLGHIFDEGVGDFVINTDGTDPYSGIDAPTLSLIDTSGYSGFIHLGVVSDIDSEDFLLNNDGSTGAVELILGSAIGSGGALETPELSATGSWNFSNEPSTSTVTLELEDVVVNTGGSLELDGITLVVTGDIDLTPLDVADLSLDDTTIEVAEGATLTLTVEQVTALQNAIGGPINVFGEGTVEVIGESDDSVSGIDTDFSNLNTATVDLSAVTLGATDDGVLNITANGVHADETQATRLVGVAQTIIGSDNNDAVTIGAAADDGDATTIDVITRLGLDGGDIGDVADTPDGVSRVPDPTEVEGDMIINAGTADIQIEADAGFDQVDVLRSGDVVQVASGAEFYGVVSEGSFVATADTTNDGTAVLETIPPFSATVETIDVSAAGGTNGWTLVGAPDDTGGAFGNNLLIGSGNDDTLVDGPAGSTPVLSDNDGNEDSFTGNDGADTFLFNVISTNPLILSDNVDTPAVDEETIEITAADTVDGDNETITFDYAAANVIGSVTIQDGPLLGDVDFSDTGSIAAALATALNNLTNVSAAVDGVNPDLVVASGDNGERFDVTASSSTNLDAGTFAGVTISDGADTPQSNTVTISTGASATASAGELYTMTVQLSEGTDITAEYLAAGGETPAGIAAQLVTDFNATAPASTVNAIDNTDGTITLDDEEDDNGGFTVSVLSATSSVGAASFSSLLTGGETFASANMDVITDFMDSEGDLISFGLDAGDGNNYDEAAYEANFGAAQTAADNAFAADNDLIYFLTGSTDDNSGLLFLNLDGDTDADAVIALTGVNAGNFDSDNIV